MLIREEYCTVVCPNKHPPPSENLAYWGGGDLSILVFVCLILIVNVVSLGIGFARKTATNGYLHKWVPTAGYSLPLISPIALPR